MIPSLSQIQQYKNQEDLVDSEKVQDSDLLLVHGIYSAYKVKQVKPKTLLLNHGAARKHTYAFEDYLKTVDPSRRFLLKSEIDQIRRELEEIFLSMDIVASESDFVRSQLEDYFGISSEVVHSPIDRDFFCPRGNQGDYYFSAQRLIWEKRVDAQIEAFKELDEKLIIAGKGRFSEEVRKTASKHSNIKFVGHVEGEELLDLYSGAKAFIHSGVKEEFPQSLREANSCGTPVIGVRSGGVPEIVDSDKLGVLYDPSNRVEGIRESVRTFDRERYDEETLRRSTERYATDKFEKKIKEIAEGKFS